MEVIARTQRIGANLLVAIPEHIVMQQEIKNHEFIHITVRKVRQSGFGMCKGLGRFTREDKFQ